MKLLDIWTCVVLAVGTLPIGTLAQECYTNTTSSEGSDEGILSVTSQGQLNTFLADCTTVVGSIQIDSSYSGAIAFNGITNVTGRIFTDSSTSSENPLSIQMPDVINIGGLSLSQVSDLQLPKVERVGTIYFSGSSSIEPESDLDLPSLVNADSVIIEGNWSGVSLRALRKVTGELKFCSAPGCVFNETHGQTTIDFSVLESAAHIGVDGSVSRLSLPRLRTLGVSNADASFSPGLNVQVFNCSLRVDLPALTTLNGLLTVEGSFDKLMMNALEHTEAQIMVHSDIPASILSTIVSAASIDISGKIDLLGLPNLVDVDRVNITPETPIPCDEALIRLWESKYDSQNITWCVADQSMFDSYFNNDADATNGTETDNWYDDYFSDEPMDTSPGLSREAKSGIIVACVLVGLAVLSAVFFARRKMSQEAKNKNNHQSMDASQVELANRGQQTQQVQQPIQNMSGQPVGLDAPPPYSREALPPPPEAHHVSSPR